MMTRKFCSLKLIDSQTRKKNMPPRSRVRRTRENEEVDNNSKSDSHNRSEFHPLNRVVYAQIVMKFAATKMSNMVRLSATCETWRDTFENYGHVVANAALKYDMSDFMMTAKSIHRNVKQNKIADDAISFLLAFRWMLFAVAMKLPMSHFSAAWAMTCP